MINRDKLTVTGFPKVTRRLDLVEFADFMRANGIDEEGAAAVEEILAGNYLSVWLNHNEAFRDRWLAWNEAAEKGNQVVRSLQNEGLQKEPDEGRIAKLTAELNRHNAETLALGREVEGLLLGCEPEDVTAINDLSPELYRWVTAHAWEMVGEYRSGRKKERGG